MIGPRAKPRCTKGPLIVGVDVKIVSWRLGQTGPVGRWQAYPRVITRIVAAEKVAAPILEGSTASDASFERSRCDWRPRGPLVRHTP
jgi:hypothetical protein